MTFGRFILIVSGILLLLAPDALATSARVNSLGGGGEYFEDDHNIQRWYGSLVDYPDRLILDSGHFNINNGYHEPNGVRVSGPAGEIILGLGRWKLPGVVSAGLYTMGDDVDGGGLHRDQLRTTLSLMYGFQIKSVCAALVYRHGTDNGNDLKYERYGTDLTLFGTWPWDRTRNNLGLGLRFDLSDDAYLDLAGETRCVDGDLKTDMINPDLPPDVSTPSRSIFDSYNLRARAFVRLGEFLALVPVMEWTRDDRRIFNGSYTRPFRLDGGALKIGAGLNYYPDPDHLVLLSADFTRGGLDYTRLLADPGSFTVARDEWNALHSRLALESVFLSWLTVRSGVILDLLDETVDHQTNNYASLHLALGAAIHVGNWDLDLSLNEGEPRTPGSYLGWFNWSLNDTWLTASLRHQF